MQGEMGFGAWDLELMHSPWWTVPRDQLLFVDEKVQWMHIDLAGPVWNEKKRTATGFGISTLVEWVLQNSS
ncbi:hypothetical protein GH714_009010 [Hevea brasiliensis]|uniref:Uncharacterized protein n=1 Tax=Hevea brasiliensis TaxID=3981 RepID=A0A6A6M9H0_HEVBR|nr:hypothetical protein GH714_009010 [Hevea brasiliensis]